tara:strand:+ start:927 stop:2765 length:1839 start_codon:yes stop_codon:yes gene_type:complete
LISILGISAYYHDSAAALIIDGKIISAAQEERFSRKKHDSSFPKNAINFVLKKSNLKLSDIDNIVFYEKPFLKFERLLETYVAYAPRGFKSFSLSMPIWLREKLFQKKMLFNSLKSLDSNFKNNNKIFFSEHHLSHAASAFYPSPFDKAIILTADGVGEWATTTVAIGSGKSLEIKKEIHFPHSLGLLYSAFTYYLGFKVNSGEYKLMGLAPYGQAKYTSLIIDKLIHIKDDGSFRLDQSYFNYSTGLTMTNEKFNNLFGKKPRNFKNEKITQFHMNIAASIQEVINIIMLKLARSLKKEFNIDNLCLAGGVALNSVANGKILKEKIFKNIWIQPAAGDAGGSLGAAQAFWHLNLNKDREIDEFDSMQGSFLGPEYTNNEIQSDLKQSGAIFKVYEEDEIIEKTATCLSEGKVIGWFQGKMEFGPRALGSRSIIADARNINMQKNLNLKVKFRESFRPFAPSILYEDVNNWFDINTRSPYMLFVCDISERIKIDIKEEQKELYGFDKLNIKRSEIPAVTHVDYSARIQTVHKETNKKYYSLIKKFKQLTNCPIVLNTSFNIRGEPIVNTILDAFNCFIGTDMDVLVIGNCLLEKKDQNKSLKFDYKGSFELD